jgi:hypothetical protein
METITLDPVTRLTRDIRNAATLLSINEARYLVDSYYQIQEYRKSAGNQARSLVTAGEPNEVISWLFKQQETLEGQIKRALDAWTDSNELGQWSKSIVGIGPVISAGLLAHIDIAKAPTAGHIWRFAGLDPTMKWEKGEKRPWNASLKTLTWKIGESFVKVSNNPKDFYGKIYQERKDLESRRNDEGAFAQQAADKLERFKIGKDTEAYAAYSSGKLPPAHIHSRAKRYAVKLFLAHYQHVGWKLIFKTDPPRPYVIEHLGHGDYIAPPNF